MTSPLSRSRSRQVPSHIAVRVAHTVLGGLMAVGWLVLPLATEDGEAPVTAARNAQGTDGAVAQETAASDGPDGTTNGDLVLPLVAVGTAAALGAYGYARRKQRARTRTTPGGHPAGLTSVPELDRQIRSLLVDTDDCVRTSAEELDCARAQFGDAAVEPYAGALAGAKSELAAAFGLRQLLEETGRGAEDRGTLEEIRAHCGDAGRRLDAEAAGFDQLRGLEHDTATALGLTETRFRAVAARTPAMETTLGELHKRYARSATAPVTGHREHTKERLVFATIRLNLARQCADRGKGGKAAAFLRAAEGALGQAALLIDGVDRLAGELGSAEGRLPAALDTLEDDLAEARGPRADGAVGELPVRVAHAEALLVDVRREITAGPYDPLDALRQVAEAGVVLAEVCAVPGERFRALRDDALLPARAAVGAAEDFVATNREAVGCAARTRLAAAEQLLAAGAFALAEVRRADVLGREARDLAERDVRAHGNPAGGYEGAGVGGAVLGGILLPGAAGPACFGGPRTRRRRAVRPD
ncbi:hypothetical protein BKI49_23860 [Streptomyces sp. Tue6028]|nr:hypothetical protein BKI49_23860 [Streptomyces sp. Tue6028]